MLLDVFDNTTDLLLFLHHVLYHFLMLFQRLGNLTTKNPILRDLVNSQTSQNILQNLTKRRMSSQIPWYESTIPTVH